MLAAPLAHADDIYVTSGPRLRESSKLPNGPLLTTGLLTFFGGYATAFVTAAVSTRSDDRALYAPIVGPWIDIGTRRCRFEGTACDTDDVERGLIIAMGIAQGIGLVLVGTSLVLPEKRIVESAKIRFTPQFGPRNAGAAIVGTF